MVDVPFISVGLNGHEGGSVEGHGGGVLAQLSVEAVRALAGELVLRLVHQERQAGSAVEARHVDAAQQLHRAVLATVVVGAVALVVGHQVDALAVDARSEPLALVDLHLHHFKRVSGCCWMAMQECNTSQSSPS